MKRRKSGRAKNLILLLFALGLFFSGGLFLWAATLSIPDLNAVEERKLSESTKIYDRTGKVLLYDVHEGKQRTVIPLEDISRHLKNATVAIEDTSFYEHRGIVPSAILRAIFVNVSSLGFEQGGSTITQQVVKNSLLTTEKTITRKLKEWVLALKLEDAVSKERILELYLNEAPYGGSVYGAEEASRMFFDKSAGELTLPEAAYLAALPQAPTYYSPHGNNTDELEERKNLVLKRMRELNFITEDEYEKARVAEVKFQPQSTLGIRAPHFVFYVLEQLEKKYGRNEVENGGLRVVTTLDYALQEKAEATVKEFAEGNTEKFNATNAGLVAIDPKTGHILVMVGSKDYFAEDIDGNFNTVIHPNRQPGSAFKPFVYATALKKGFTPETVVFDLETQFNVGCDADGKPLYPNVEEDECYMPSNYDDVFRGPVTFREAFAQSINVPAVKVLYLSGLTDSLKTARRMGITSLTDPNRYGLTLVLGGGEVSLLEMTNAYSVFANEGKLNRRTAIIKVEDSRGNIREITRGNEERVLPRDVALTITDILSDNEARTPAFGAYSPLYFPGRDVAAKTGTTNDYRDAWIIGYTPNIAVGAWAGNNDNTPMAKKVAGFIIAPLWHSFMEQALAVRQNEVFTNPEKETNTELKPVLRGYWQGGLSYFIDTISGKLATQYTPEETKEERFVTNVHSILRWVDKDDPRGNIPKNPADDPQFSLWEKPVRKWAKENGIKDGLTDAVVTEYDDVHTPEKQPRLSVLNIKTDAPYNRRDRITFTVAASGPFPLSSVDIFVNNAYVGSIKKPPFSFSFIPAEIPSIKQTNILRVAGYDSVKNKGEREVVFQVNL